MGKKAKPDEHSPPKTVSVQDAIILLSKSGQLQEMVEEASNVAVTAGLKAFKEAFKSKLGRTVKEIMVQAANAEAQREMFGMTDEEREEVRESLKEKASSINKKSYLTIKEAQELEFAPESRIRKAVKNQSLSSERSESNKILIRRTDYLLWVGVLNADL